MQKPPIAPPAIRQPPEKTGVAVWVAFGAASLLFVGLFLAMVLAITSNSLARKAGNLFSGSIKPVAVKGRQLVEKKAPPRKMETVLKVSGSGIKTTGDFVIKGRNTILAYGFNAGESKSGVLYATVYDSTTDRRIERAVSAHGAKGSDTTRLRLKPGTYYLKINAANCSWAVEVLN